MAFSIRILFCVFLLSQTHLVHADDTDQLRLFQERIEPILQRHCYKCHGAEANLIEGGLRLDSRTGILSGGDTGPAAVAGQSSKSLIISALRHEDLEMPPDRKLPDNVIRDFEEWIDGGAVTPPRFHTPRTDVERDYSEDRKYWAFQPVRRPRLPAIVNPEAAANSVDRFVLAKLQKHQLTFSPPASRRELIRRVYFDVIGLPPTPQQVTAFVQDRSPRAYSHMVDRLLASPRYGERWAQFWLDVVRYAETEGFEYDRLLRGAWRFRDYVIQAFNEDMPYDEFITQQLAGDEMDSNAPQLRIAAGFHRLGTVRRNAGNQLVASSRNEVLTERTDIVGAAFLGLTVGCARCHDHKFDPISHNDYYQLQAFFAATQEDNVIFADTAIKQAWQAKTERIQSRIDDLQKQAKGQQEKTAKAIRAKIKALEAELPAPLPVLCSIKNDAASTTPIHVLRRGDPDLPGDLVSPRPLGVLTTREDWSSSTENPRSKLAAWLTRPKHPLTARVFVNRIWQQHFGRGLVETANDFGKNGAKPSHPQLLDYLAANLVEHNWHVKPLHRLILLSNTYRQSSAVSPQLREQDPHNRLLARFSRRRLTAEELRDAMLSISGQLNDKASGESVIVPVEQNLVDQLYKTSQWQVTKDEAEHYRRGIFLLAKRNLRLPFMEVFDQPAAQTSCALREQSTHAPQALELLNGRLSNQLATNFTARLRQEAGHDAVPQVRLAYQLATGRNPTAQELSLATEFIQQISLEEFALAVFNLNAFLYVD